MKVWKGCHKPLRGVSCVRWTGARISQKCARGVSLRWGRLLRQTGREDEMDESV